MKDILSRRFWEVVIFVLLLTSAIVAAIIFTN